MKASVVILNWNGGSANCIDATTSAVAQEYEDKEVIFVDNGSTDGSLSAVRAVFPEITYIELPDNIGCPPGRNVGAQHASGDLLFFLENDGVWRSKFVIQNAVALFRRHDDLGAVYIRVEDYETGKADPPLDPSPSNDPREGLYLSSSFRGGASVVRRDLFIKCGQFPGDFFRQGEERFLSLLIYDTGFRVAYWPEFSLRHKGSDYTGKAATVNQHTFENSLKTVIRLYPASLAVLIGIAKWASLSYRLMRMGQWRIWLRVTLNLSRELIAPSQYARVSIKTLRAVETLRQGATDNLYHQGNNVSLTMRNLILRRLFARGSSGT